MWRFAGQVRRTFWRASRFIMDSPNSSSSRLRQRRQELGLTVRDVEATSQLIARQHGNRAFVVRASRLSEFETQAHARVPSAACLYSLSVIFNQSVLQVGSWFGLELGPRVADRELVAAALERRTRPKQLRRQRKTQALAEREQRAQQKRQKREQRKQRLVKWLRRGISYSVAAQRLGLSRQYVYQLATEAGFSWNAQQRRERAQQERRLLSLLRRGLSYAQAAQRLGVSRQRLYRMAPQGARPLELRRKLREQQGQRLLLWFRRGLTYRQAARRSGISKRHAEYLATRGGFGPAQPPRPAPPAY